MSAAEFLKSVTDIIQEKVENIGGLREDDMEELGVFIAGLFVMDSTESGPAEGQVWLSDGLLGFLEVEVGHKQVQWQILHDLLLEVNDYVDHPWNAALTDIGMINAARRVEAPDADLIGRLFTDLELVIRRLDQDSSRYDRVVELYDYHRGIWAGMTGDYLTSRDLHYASARRAEESDSWTGKLTSRLCAASDNVNLQLLQNAEVSDALEELVGAGLHLVSEFDDDTDATQRRWKCLNVPAHIIRAHGWGNIPLEDELAVRICSLLQEFSASDPEVYEDHEDLIAACKGALAFMNGDLETATDIIDSVLMTESASEEIVMTAHLIRARIYVQSGDDESAVEHYGAIIDRASAQFSQLVAIAKREMAALSNG